MIRNYNYALSVRAWERRFKRRLYRALWTALAVLFVVALYGQSVGNAEECDGNHRPAAIIEVRQVCQFC